MYRQSAAILPGLFLCGLLGTCSSSAQEPTLIQDGTIQQGVVYSERIISETPANAYPVTEHSIVSRPAEITLMPVPTVSPQPAMAPSMVKWISSYGPARRAGTKQKKPVMLFLTMDGCMHCTRMEHVAFSDASIAARLNNRFVPARVKVDHKSKLAKDLKVSVFPTTVFIAPDGKILEYVRGYITTQKLRDHMDQVSNEQKQQTASLSSLAK